MTSNPTPQATLEETLRIYRTLSYKAVKDEDYESADEATKIAIEAIRAWAVSQLPEKKDLHKQSINIHLDNQYVGFNQAIDQATQSLRGKK